MTPRRSLCSKLFLFFLLGFPYSGGVGVAAPDPGTIIRSHRASMILDPGERILECRDTLDLLFRAPAVDTVVLKFHPGFDISSFTARGKEMEYSRGRGTLSFRVEREDSIATIEIAYRGRVDFPSEFTRMTEDRVILREEEVLPWGGRDLYSGRLRVTVPRGWMVIAPGDRTLLPSSGGADTWVFEWHVPIPAIGWLCAGPYKTFHREDDPFGISLFFFGEDTPETEPIFGLCDSLLAFYSGAFTPYRYHRLDVVEIEDWVGGPAILAIAAPSFVMVKKSTLMPGDPLNAVGTILPHEIAHQWWMGSVFLDGRDAPFLSEGLSEYSSILFSEWRGWGGSRDSLSRHPLLRKLLSKVKRQEDLPLDSLVDIRRVTTHYLKAAYVHHMLRNLLGDPEYRSLLRQFARSYEGRWASVESFREIIRTFDERDLDWFFNEWVSGTGVPALRLYNFHVERSGETWVTTGRARVLGYKRFSVDVVVELYTTGVPARLVKRLGVDATGRYVNDIPIRFETRDQPRRVILDPDGDILMMRNIPARLSELQEPGPGVMIIGSGPESLHYSQLARRDSLALGRQGWALRILEDTEASLGDLQNPNVILYGNSTDNSVVRNLPVRFPLMAEGDNEGLWGAALADSSLAMTQIMENPYMPDGFMISISPFGPSAMPELLPTNHSWTLQRGRDIIDAGVWDVVEEDIAVDLDPDS